MACFFFCMAGAHDATYVMRCSAMVVKIIDIIPGEIDKYLDWILQ